MRLTTDVPGRRICFSALILSATVLAGGVGRAQQFASRDLGLATGPGSPVQTSSRVQPTSRVRAATGLRPIFRSLPGEHPLMPGVRCAEAGIKQMESLHDYSCTFVKRERVE